MLHCWFVIGVDIVGICSIDRWAMGSWLEPTSFKLIFPWSRWS
jgi:hypothetical protein